MNFENTLIELVVKFEKGEITKGELIEALTDLHNHKLGNAQQVSQLRKGIIDKLMSERKESNK